MFSDFVPFDISLDPAVTIHGICSGHGPALLLLHGFPQNLNIWHLVASKLTDTYTVVALDLRGYGQSSKPTAGEDHKTYSKKTMAQDCIGVMTTLGHEHFYVCAHDRGARVAHKMCVEHPDKVRKAMFLDIAPTLAMYSKTDLAFAKAYWHWFFLIQPSPLPEKLILANPRAFIENTMGGPNGVNIGDFDRIALESCVNQLGDEDCVRGMCEDYRASAGIDLEEAREDIEKGRRIKCPLRVLWGKKGVVEAQFDALVEWRAVTEGDLVDGESIGCGHYIPEHAPEELLRHIREFLRD
ncbi:hypothetical protein ACLMJK_006968 [Lecanora helva]